MPSFFKRSLLPKLRGFPLTPDALDVLSGADAYRRCLLEKISQATRRIYIVALYLQHGKIKIGTEPHQQRILRLASILKTNFEAGEEFVRIKQSFVWWLLHRIKSVIR